MNMKNRPTSSDCIAHCLTRTKATRKVQSWGDYGNTIVIRLTSGKEISECRDEVIIYD